MGSLSNKRVLLGVTGGIAAYKSAELIRCLQGQNAEVRVVMTPAATEFITPLTLQALSGNPVSLELLDTAAEAAMGHIELARWADLILVAPASADFIAKMAHGLADDLASTTVLATDTGILLAPAMNVRMWGAGATQRNLELLRGDGVQFVGPDEGDMACGEFGPGRLAEPAAIVEAIAGYFTAEGTRPLKGRKIIVTSILSFAPIPANTSKSFTATLRSNLSFPTRLKYITSCNFFSVSVSVFVSINLGTDISASCKFHTFCSPLVPTFIAPKFFLSSSSGSPSNTATSLNIAAKPFFPSCCLESDITNEVADAL